MAVNTWGMDIKSLAQGVPPALASQVPRLLKDICSGSTCDSDPKFLTPVGGSGLGRKVVFSAKTLEHGREEKNGQREGHGRERDGEVDGYNSLFGS